MNGRHLLEAGPRVVNLGLAGFADDLRRNGAPVVHVDWSPPGVSPEVLAALDNLQEAARERIAAANRKAIEIMLAAEPVWCDVRPAGEVIEGLGDRMILHAGPPIEWNRMCGPMRGAIAGAIVLEGWADDLEAAMEIAARGDIDFQPNHHFDAVGPMTGLTTRSMPVMVVENRRYGNRAYCTLNEGLGTVMRFGGNSAEVLDRLRWMSATFGPILSKALAESDGIALKSIVARGLTMGDEMHQRNVACTSLLLRELAPVLVRTSSDTGSLESAIAFIAGNDQFFLNVAMVMGKAIMDPVRGIEASSIVTAMARNGTDFGVRISATDERWFTAPVEMPQGLYFPGFTEADANPDMGDSTIVETIGLGGFAMAASPAVAGFVGAGDPADAPDFTRRMCEITAERNPEWTIPAMSFSGVPTGIDILKVLDTGIVPTINTGVAHKEPGVGQVGAGVVNAPMACFEQAFLALLETFDPS